MLRHSRNEETLMNLKPLGDRVIVSPDEPETTTSAGLFLASDVKDMPQTGTVLAVGTGKFGKDGIFVPMPIEIGDRVLYSKYGGTEIFWDDQDVLIMRVDDIYAVIE